MGKGYEYARTSQRCGKQWYVPADVAEAKPRKQAKMAGWLTPIVGAKRQELRAQQAMVAMQNQQMAQAGQCPQCGSSAYNEQRVSV